MSSKHLKNFSALSSPKKIGKAFLYYPVRYFRGPYSGQIQAVKRTLTRSDLNALERFFKQHPPESRVDRKDAFFAFFRGALDAPTHALLKQEGWTERKADGGLRLNIWHKPTAFRLPDGYTATIATARSRKEILDHSQAIDRFFKAKGRFAEAMPRYFKQRKGAGFVVNIREASGRVCASGTVVVNGPYAFLFSGSVDPRHRRKGLWRALVGLRQLVSAQHGARQWALTTTTKAILKKADQSVPFGLYLKQSD